MFNKSINPKKIKPNTDCIGQSILYYKTISSTNDLAKQKPLKDGAVIIAESQTKGRGRMGRQWVSAKKQGIYMTMVLTPEILPQYINQITLVTGLAVCKTLSNLYNTSFKIKWPNDIVFNGKKICGILVEGIAEKDRVKVINGIGINVNNKKIPEDLKYRATSLYILTGKKFQREKIINTFCEIFEKYYKLYTNEGVDCILNEYKEKCVTLGREIMVIQKGDTIKATALDINEKGELIIKKEDGTTLNINSGEVSVRGIYGY